MTETKMALRKRKPSYPAPEQRELGPQIRSIDAVPSLSAVVLEHFRRQSTGA